MLVASPDMESHRRDLQLLFDRLQEHGLVLNLEKCSFGQPTVEFLGHTITAGGATPLTDSVAAIKAMSPPTTVKELQAFLGSVNFYRRFLPSIAKVLVPLTAVLKGGPKGGSRLEWTLSMQSAFESAKQALCTAARLAFHHPKAAISIMVDASDSHIGSVLQQRRPGLPSWGPLGFFSSKLQPAQAKYSAFDRELFAAYSAVKYFRFMLEGRQFTLFTDHLPLTHALHSL
jgi:cleavage and polyadenylation specificity factor subunit 1